MCQFVSWVEKDKKVFYLTDKQLKTKKGKALIVYIGIDNIRGHGAIRKYYWGSEGVRGGENKEWNDFSSPKNFPKEIALSLLRGEFKSEYFDMPIGMLTEPAWDEYEEITQRIWDRYKIQQQTWAEYQKTRRRAFYKLSKNPENLNEEWKKFAKENK